MNLGAQTKEALKKSSVLRYIHSEQKNFSMKKTPEAWPMWKSIIPGQK